MLRPNLQNDQREDQYPAQIVELEVAKERLRRAYEECLELGVDPLVSKATAGDATEGR